MTKQEKKPQAQPKAKEEKKSKSWACDCSVTGWGLALEGSPVLPEQLAAFAKFNPEGDLSKYQK